METEGRKKLPIGVSDFQAIMLDNAYYVDKTHFVARLIDNICSRGAVLFTRPRRFGKSLALDMLRCFFDCNEREQNRPLFEGLSVAQSERCMLEQGKYPVIYFDFTTAKGGSLESLIRNLRNAFLDALAPIEYLLHSDKLNDLDKARLYQLLDPLTDVATAVGNISTSMGLVCSLLVKHHGQPVVILVDEYDIPLQSAYLNGFYQPVCELMRNLFSSALKNNRYLRMGVLTGVLRIAKESLFSGLNNLEVDTILSRDYADCFGFTQAEVDALAEYFGAGDKREEIKDWYDGYRFGQLDIYNPWSLLEYFKHKCEPDAYWLDTSSNDITRAFLKRLVKSPDNPVVQLSQGGVVNARIEATVSYAQLENQASGDSEDNDRLYSLMAVTGYLKPVECIRDDRYKLKIPNREIRTIYADEILNYLKQGLHIGDLAVIGDAIVQGQEQRFTELLNKYMLASLSYYDSAESFYHGWVMGLLLILDNDYYGKSNREAGNGRADIMLTPRPNCKGPGLIFEFKYCDKPEQLPGKAEEALLQIEGRRYFEEFPPRVMEVFGYGMSFCAKECAITHRVWKR